MERIIGKLRVQQKEQMHTISWNIQEQFSASGPQWKTIFKGNHYGNEQEKAELIVQAVNSHQAMKEALRDLVKAVHATGFHKDIKKSFSLRVAVVQAEKALTLANGGE